MRGRRWLGGALAVAATVAVAGLSRVPWTASAGDGALLRLSWRVPGVEVEHCRSLTDEEEADLPAHMRAPEVCEGEGAPWTLVVRLDGRTVVDDTVRPAGVRGDRPVSVFRELGLRPGSHRVEVAFRPAWPAEAEPPEGPLRTYDVARTVSVPAGAVALVSVPDSGGGLDVLLPPDAPGEGPP